MHASGLYWSSLRCWGISLLLRWHVTGPVRSIQFSDPIPRVIVAPFVTYTGNTFGLCFESLVIIVAVLCNFLFYFWSYLYQIAGPFLWSAAKKNLYLKFKQHIFASAVYQMSNNSIWLLLILNGLASSCLLGQYTSNKVGSNWQIYKMKVPVLL